MRCRIAHQLSPKLAIARQATAAAITFTFVKVESPPVIILSEFPVAPATATEQLAAIAALV